MAMRQQGNELGKKETLDFNSEASVGKPWTSRIDREQFGTFSSNFPRRNGDATNYQKKQTERKREGNRRFDSFRQSEKGERGGRIRQIA
eukprot:scaffold73110_cov49-Attheya_sp.AAC.1